MKKFFTVLALLMALFMLVSCAPPNVSIEATPAPREDVKPAEINVVTSFGGDDGNRLNYENAYKAYEAATGNIVRDFSNVSNEAWKAGVLESFENGQEPDVLFFFTGSDANKLIESGKVMSVEKIRQAYPEYASNMKDDMLPKSPVDGESYAIPVSGYWEGLFVNKQVLEACGVDIPGPYTTWTQFLADCAKIAYMGYVPIAASLNEVPHYWFEFCVLNNGDVDKHNTLPASSGDAAGKAWAAGLNDIKQLYERGFFPEDTLTATSAQTDVLMIGNKAAFMIEGSWKLGWIAENAADINNFTVTYVPGKGNRRSTDIIGGLSMGYYITTKAWHDPNKREACVRFVEAMTEDSVVAAFGATSVTALKSGLTMPEDASPLVIDALEMANNVSGISPATGDNLTTEARADLFSNVKRIVTGEMSAEEAIDRSLSIGQ